MNKIFKCKCGNEIPRDFAKDIKNAQMLTGPRPNEKPMVNIRIEVEKDAHSKSETVRYQVLCGHCGILLHKYMLKQSFVNKEDSLFDAINAFNMSAKT